MHTGTILGIIGGVIGILGGLYGTYTTIRKVRSPEEKSFMINCSIAIWVLVTLFLCGLFLLPEPYDNYVWLLYIFAMLFGTQWINRKHKEIREDNKHNDTR